MCHHPHETFLGIQPSSILTWEGTLRSITSPKPSFHFMLMIKYKKNSFSKVFIIELHAPILYLLTYLSVFVPTPAENLAILFNNKRHKIWSVTKLKLEFKSQSKLITAALHYFGIPTYSIPLFSGWHSINLTSSDSHYLLMFILVP